MREPGDAVLNEQIRYYSERAAEYEDWWYRRGRYDKGVAANRAWRAEAEELENALESFKPGGDIVELACGTGIWTRGLARRARTLTAVDASSDMLALNRSRVSDPAVRYLQADLFSWNPGGQQYDLCFFGFWLSHIPEERMAAFWRLVDRIVRPEGQVFFVDSARGDLSSKADRHGGGQEMMIRKLEDGREFHIIKRYYEPRDLGQRIARLGWNIEVKATAECFIYGHGGRGAQGS